jgi:uncharacterized protein YbjQ (UPF0145 family)
MAETKVCVRIGCSRIGIATTDARCPECDFPTHSDLIAYPDLPPEQQIALPTPVIVVTTNTVPGHEITDVQGDAFGVVVMAQHYFSNLGAQLRTVSGGEVVGYTKLLTTSRNTARERLVREVRRMGGNAVLAMRFDCNSIGNIMTEVAAYGTAATIVKSSVGISESSHSAKAELG